MKQKIKQIENYIQLHTSDIDNEDYIEIMRAIAEWAKRQADIVEFPEELIFTENNHPLTS